MRRAQVWFLALMAGGCASTKSSDLQDENLAALGRKPPERWDQKDSAREGMPFIKLAKRELGLVIHWVGAPPGVIESLQRELARRLKTTYREPLFEFVREGKFEGFDSAMYVDLAEHSVDDAVIVEIAGHPEDQDDHGFDARVLVMTLSDERIVLDASLPRIDGARFADRVWMVIAKNWTDPGAGVALDPERIADRLAERGSCDEAVKVYSLAKTHARKPTSVAEAQVLDQSHVKLQRCKDEIAMRELIARDRAAVFGISVVGKAVAPNITAALRHAADNRSVRATLEAMTNKPVVIEATTDAVVLDLRYHPERYQQATRSQPKFIMNQRALYLAMYLKAMSTLAQIRDTAVEKLSPYDAPLARKLTTVLRLSKLNQDYIEIDFAEVEGRILLTEKLHVKIGTRPEVLVQTVASSLLHDHVFLLAPPHEVTGELTDHGLVYKFFEIE